MTSVNLKKAGMASRNPGGGGGTPTHYLYGYVPPNGGDFEAPDLERGIYFRGVF